MAAAALEALDAIDQALADLLPSRSFGGEPELRQQQSECPAFLFVELIGYLRACERDERHDPPHNQHDTQRNAR